MLIFKTALKNIISGGKKTWLNISIIAFVFILVLGVDSIDIGWAEDAKKQTINWQAGGGQIWHQKYDPFDPFTFTDSHAKIPAEYETLIEQNKLVPILLVPATLYINQNPLNVYVKGINPEQTILEIPSDQLKQHDKSILSFLINQIQANNLKFNDSTNLMLRWKTQHGSLDAKEVMLENTYQSTVYSPGVIELWMDIQDVYAMLELTSAEATYFTLAPNINQDEIPKIDGWIIKDQNELLTAVLELEKGDKRDALIRLIILLIIALLPIFDTQILSIFKRQKEIGIYVALGMTPKKVVALFTIEGVLYSALGILVGLIVGLPIYYYFTAVGIPIQESFQSLGVPMGARIYPLLTIKHVLSIIGIIIIASLIISYIPARKIAKQNISLTLKGKVG